MAISHLLGVVTRSENSLKDLLVETEKEIEKWKGLKGVDLTPALKEELLEAKTRLELRTDAMRKAMRNFSKEAEDLPDENDIAKYKEKVEAETATGLRSQLAVEALDMIIIRLDRVLKSQKEEQRGHSSQSSVQGDTPSGPGSNQPQLNQELYLEESKWKNQVPKFSGKKADWDNFWTLYNHFVHQSRQHPLIKYNQLLKCLEGEAQQLAKQFKIAEENYEPLVTVLKEEYENKQCTIKELHDELRKAEAKGKRWAEQKDLMKKINIILAQLEQQGVPNDSKLVIDMILTKFNYGLRKRVVDKLEDAFPQHDWKLSDMMKGIKEAIAREEQISLWSGSEERDSGKSNDDKKEDKKKPAHKSKSNEDHQKATKKELKRTCLYCGGDHSAAQCTTVERTGKIAFLKEESRCFRCLRQNHSSSNCNTDWTCRKCKGPHHTSICDKDEKKATSKATPTSKPTVNTTKVHMAVSEVDNESYAMTINTLRKKRAYIPTVQVKAFNERGNKYENVSVMLDSGADQSYITRATKENWNLPHMGFETLKVSVFGQSDSTARILEKTKLRLKVGSKTMEIEPLTEEHVCGPMRKAELSKEDLQFALENNIHLNKEVLETHSEPILIVGCDYINEMVEGTQTRLPSGMYLLHTIFGATTMGKKKSEQDQQQNEIEYETSGVYSIQSEQAMEFKQEEDTRMKGPGEFSGPMTEEQADIDQKTWQYFKDTIEQRQDGYYVKIPYKEDAGQIPNNYAIALRRLQSVKKTVTPEVLQMIDDVFQDQLEKGIIEEVTPIETARVIHYNPHQPVLTPHKSTTKCRVVIDGSSHFKNEKSLNDVIHQGPVILPDIVDMLIRFRAGENVVLSDVEKAFLQVKFHEDDRDATRVLWLRDCNKRAEGENIVEYRFTRVLFGLNVSPFLLGATILHHLEKMEDTKLAQEWSNNLYVDNLVMSTDGGTEETIQLYHKAKETFTGIAMNLREFLSNNQEFNRSIPECDRAQDTMMKVLGITWDSIEDNITMTCENDSEETPSRRTVASFIAGNYDPLGLLVPLIFKMKIFQRLLWKPEFEYGWDTPINQTHLEEWRRIVMDIENFQKELPRHVISKTGPNTIITFTDASSEATACAVYIRNDRGTNIIYSKSKVRSLKEVWTIPKLEMQALTMGAEYTTKTLKAIIDGNMKEEHIFIFTDSEIALKWLQSTPGKKEVGVLVANRILSIRDYVEQMQNHEVPVKFGHVTTKENPADLGTRGATKHEIQDTIWWKGPPFLQTQTDDWKCQRQTFELTQDDGELHIVNSCRKLEVVQQKVFDETRTNSWQKFKRVAAYVFRFLKKITKNLPDSRKASLLKHIPELDQAIDDGAITAQEMQAAEIRLLKEHQQQHVGNGKPKLLRNLGLEFDENGLIVCRGRMENLEEYPTSRPILVMPKTKLAEMIILHKHGKCHATLDNTMAAVREKFWIPQLRQQGKSVISRCVKCQMFNKLPCQYPNMAKMPKERITVAKPFERTGLDYFGPIEYKDTEEIKKAYVALFTCSTTRLVQLEVVKDMTTSSFINAMRRFISNGGIPTSIVSDNAPTFILGSKIVKEAQRNCELSRDIQEYLGNQEIQWSFITPYAPWKGGMYERMVKTVKHAFIKGVGRNRLSLDELETCCKEVAASVNSRPLTYMEEDVDALVIRPCDFVHQKMKFTLLLDGTSETIDEYLPSKDAQLMKTKSDTIKALKSSIEATDKIWNLWRSKYMAELRESHKLRMDSKRGTPTIPRIGQIVLICDEYQPRNYWRFGKVEKQVQSKDGVIREVHLKVANDKTVRRPINLVVPLEMDYNESNYEESAAVWLPPAIKMSNHHVVLKSIKDGQITLLEKECHAESICNTIDCTFCLSNIINPECSPYWAIAGVAIFVYCFAMLIYCICQVPVRLVGPCIICWPIIKLFIICCWTCFRFLANKGRNWRRTTGRIKDWSLAIIGLIIMIAHIEGCQEIHLISQAQQVCSDDGNDTCHLLSTQYVKLSSFKRMACFRTVRNGTTTREIRLEMKGVEMKCLKETVSFTKDVLIKSWSSKRCADAGSCGDSKCLNITRSSILPELQKVNHLPGYTGCVESCGGPGCGCFYPSSGCLFYRVYAEPKSNTTMEIFKCSEWLSRMTIGLTVTELNEEKRVSRYAEMKLRHDQPYSQFGIGLTAEAIMTPPSPGLDIWFLKKEDATATWDDHMPPIFHCQNRDKAENNDCEVIDNCSCEPAQEEVRCTCKVKDLEAKFNTISERLPIQSGHWKLETTEKTVRAIIEEETAATVMIDIKEAVEVEILKSSEYCHIGNEHIQGCYNCIQGGKAELTCYSRKLETMADIRCGAEMFTIPCHPQGHKENITFFVSTAQFERECTVECGENPEKFKITGILKFTGSVWTSIYRIIEGSSTVYNEINWPDFSHILESYASFIKTTLLAVGGVLIIFLLTYVTLFSCATKLMKKMATTAILMILWPIKLAMSVFGYRGRRPSREKLPRHRI